MDYLKHLYFLALSFLFCSFAISAQKPIVKACGDSPICVALFSNESVYAKLNYLFTNRSMRLERDVKLDPKLNNNFYYQVGLGAEVEYEVLSDGDLFILAPTNAKVNLQKALEKIGFSLLKDSPLFKMDKDEGLNTACIYVKSVKAGEKFKCPKPWGIVFGFEVAEKNQASGEVLYNGIELPADWPPRKPWSDSPMQIPWLENPPKLINISVGRQLFFDDFLIESGTFEREFHYPVKYEKNPVLKAETPLEMGKKSRNQPQATPKSGGLWWNPEKQIFEMWYEAGWVQNLAYATSKDGINWERPNLGIFGDNNQIIDCTKIHPDSGAVVKDFQSANPDESVKLFLRGGGALNRAAVFTSPDGVNFKKYDYLGFCQDRSTMFYNPFRKKWVFSIRWSGPRGRSRLYYENSDFLKAASWLPNEPVIWASSDELDLPHPLVPDFRPQLYNLDAVAYESIMLGFFQIMTGPENDHGTKTGHPKGTNLNFAYSRDGFNWHRPDRKFAIASTYDKTWDRGYVQSLSNICLVRGDKLWFYYIGFAGDENLTTEKQGREISSMSSGMYSNGATGVAFLRRDGFASLNANEQKPLEIVTKPLCFQGKYLFVNVDSPKGNIKAELLDMRGNKIEPFTFENCLGVSGDTTISQIKWKGSDDLSALSYKPVKIKFKLDDGKFYSFWISIDESGRSDGYVGGSGPGYTSNIDTVGIKALDAESKMPNRLSNK